MDFIVHCLPRNKMKFIQAFYKRTKSFKYLASNLMNALIA